MLNRWVRYGPPRRPFEIRLQDQQARGLVGLWLPAASWGGNIMRNLVSGLGPSDGIVDLASTWTSFSDGKAMTVNANDAINFGSNVQIVGGDYTFSFWVNLPSTLSAGFNWNARGGGGDIGGWRIIFRLSTAMSMTHWSASPVLVIVNNVLLFDDKMHHYALRYDSTGTMYFYRDGQLIGSGALGQMILGSIDFTVDTAASLSYHILEIRLYNRMLNDREIYDHFAQQTRWSLYQPLHRPLGFVPVSGLAQVWPSRRHPSRNVALRL